MNTFSNLKMQNSKKCWRDEILEIMVNIGNEENWEVRKTTRCNKRNEKKRLRFWSFRLLKTAILIRICFENVGEITQSRWKLSCCWKENLIIFDARNKRKFVTRKFWKSFFEHWKRNRRKIFSLRAHQVFELYSLSVVSCNHFPSHEV